MVASIAPIKIRLDKSSQLLHLDWADDLHVSFPWAFLRAHCPSADEQVEREKQSQGPLHVLGKIPSTEIANLRMVGSYAISIDWSDGHSAGIYTWEYLRELAERRASEQSTEKPGVKNPTPRSG